jgi:hypothetical protein
MTRINCVSPTELTGKHLVAEYRELPRIFGLVAQAVERGERPDDRRNPTEYVLGTGHCRFFYPRLGYLVKRHVQLVDEMVARGYRPNYNEPPIGARGIPVEWWGDWEPDDRALALNRARIAERFAG